MADEPTTYQYVEPDGTTYPMSPEEVRQFVNAANPELEHLDEQMEDTDA